MIEHIIFRMVDHDPVVLFQIAYLIRIASLQRVTQHRRLFDPLLDQLRFFILDLA